MSLPQLLQTAMWNPILMEQPVLLSQRLILRDDCLEPGNEVGVNPYFPFRPNLGFPIA